MMWVPSSHVRKEYGISKPAISQKLSKDKPEWMRKDKRGWTEIDIESNGYKDWIAAASKLSKQRKASNARKAGVLPAAPVTNEPTAREQLPVDDPGNFAEQRELLTLREKSMRAELEKPLIENELKRYKVETAKTDLQVKAGNLIEWELCEFLFTGYIERINTEKLMFPKKLEAKIEQLVNDSVVRSPEIALIENEVIREQVVSVLSELNTKRIATEIVKMNIREIEEVIRNVKRAQADDVAAWRSDCGVK